MLGNYKARKEEVLRIYEEYLSFKNEKNYRNTINNEKLESFAKNIRDGKFNLMVAGEAKSGKSTFINAFLGTKILPMDIDQCTSALIEISHGEDKKLDALCADGTEIHESGEEAIHQFLKNNAALQDKYRKIPVTAIDDLLVKSKGKVKNEDIDALIERVKDDKPLNLEMPEYEHLIRNYIDKKKGTWNTIVTEIAISYPLSEGFKDITIIDSPGLYASGMVGEITEREISKVEAVIFIKFLSGQALDSNAFKNFFISSTNELCKGVRLLVLTGKAEKSREDAQKLLQKAKDMYNIIPEKHITSVDSKLQLFRNICERLSEEDIEKFLDKEGFDSAENRWYKTAKKVRNEFLRILEKDANFTEVHEMLEKFGRAAQTQQLLQLLGLLGQGYAAIQKSLEERLVQIEEADNDPAKLHKSIEEKIAEIEKVKVKINVGLNVIRQKYFESESARIQKRAEDELKAYMQQLSKANSLDEFKKNAIIVGKNFISFRTNLQKEIINDCNKSLVEITSPTSVLEEYLAPVFTDDELLGMQEKTKSEADEEKKRVYWEWDLMPIWGAEFLDNIADFFVGKHIGYSEKKHIEIMNHEIKAAFTKRMNVIIGLLQSDVTNLLQVYGKELSKNAELKTGEYNELCGKLKKAEDMQKEKESAKIDLIVIENSIANIKEIKGGIDAIS